MGEPCASVLKGLADVGNSGSLSAIEKSDVQEPTYPPEYSTFDFGGNCERRSASFYGFLFGLSWVGTSGWEEVEEMLYAVG